MRGINIFLLPKKKQINSEEALLLKKMLNGVKLLRMKIMMSKKEAQNARTESK